MPSTIDAEPRCLMHSLDPEKTMGPLRDAFIAEIDRMLSSPSAFVADFTGFVFPPVNFRNLAFPVICDFHNAIFTGDAIFSSAGFHRNVCFEAARFKKRAEFRETLFQQEADFFEAHFEQGAAFAMAIFERSVYFSNAEFRGTADFHSARFLSSARFRLTHFGLIENQPSPVFSLATFSQVNTLFYKTCLEQAMFTNCDITKVNFSSVNWRRRRNGKRMLFEEVLPLDNDYARPIKTEDGDREYTLIAEKYQQLKKNYDQRRDYWTAGDFHYGEMEMQRLSIHPSGRWKRFRRWWHPHFSMLAWYRRASDYGESYGRPARLILAALLLFTLLFPVLGIRPGAAANPEAKSEETYQSVWPSLSPNHDRFRAEAKLLVRSGITALDTATFERNAEYLPAYPWGRLAAIVETLLTSGLFALFLLALRRQFKR